MGRIIQRDFFPDLEKLRAQNAYLEAVERNDVEKLREIYAKYSSGKRPPTERCKSNSQGLIYFIVCVIVKCIVLHFMLMSFPDGQSWSGDAAVIPLW
jgi:hypothetical protein